MRLWDTFWKWLEGEDNPPLSPYEPPSWLTIEENPTLPLPLLQRARRISKDPVPMPESEVTQGVEDRDTPIPPSLRPEAISVSFPVSEESMVRMRDTQEGSLHPDAEDSVAPSSQVNGLAVQEGQPSTRRTR